jgi:predicted O-methyltransferase YrrM
LRNELSLLVSVQELPLRVAFYYVAARARARCARDDFSLASAARPLELAALLSLAEGRRAVVELGTGTAWTAIALALAEPGRLVITCDPVIRPERARYLRIAGAHAAARIELRLASDADGPREGDPPVEMLFIDSSHDRDGTLSAFRAWRPALAGDAIVAFHDYGHPDYPGIAEAVRELELDGTADVGLYAWRAPS